MDNIDLSQSNLQKDSEGFRAIKRFESNLFVLTDDTEISGTAILLQDKILNNFPHLKDFNDLTEQDINAFIALKPELILIGTGGTQQFLNPLFVAKLYQNHIGIETMKTDAACRTYSILASDYRNALGIFFPSL